MTIFFWIVDLIIPVLMIVFGLIYKNNAPNEINSSYGYRTKNSMQSQEAWDFAHKEISKAWLMLGVILGICIILSKLFIPIEKEWLSLIHAGIGIVTMIIPIPFIEFKLINKFKK